MVRTLITPISETISFKVPKQYIGKEIQIIAYEADEVTIVNEGVAGKKKEVSFNAIQLDTLNHKFNREEANER